VAGSTAETVRTKLAKQGGIPENFIYLAGKECKWDMREVNNFTTEVNKYFEDNKDLSYDQITAKAAKEKVALHIPKTMCIESTHKKSTDNTMHPYTEATLKGFMDILESFGVHIEEVRKRAFPNG